MHHWLREDSVIGPNWNITEFSRQCLLAAFSANVLCLFFICCCVLRLVVVFCYWPFCFVMWSSMLKLVIRICSSGPLYIGPLFDPYRSRTSLSSRSDSTHFHFIDARTCFSACVCNSVLSQSQSVLLFPLRGMRAEVTQVWETLVCWLTHTAPPPSLPAQSALPAMSVHSSHWASINHNRAHRLKTLQQVTSFHNLCGSLWGSQKRLKHKNALVGCESSCEEGGGEEVGVQRLPEVPTLSSLILLAEMLLIPNPFQVFKNLWFA